MARRGTCRCGAVAFEVDGDQACDRRDRAPEAGSAPARGARVAGLSRAHTGLTGVLWAVPRARIRLRPPEPAIGAFTYSGWLVGHRFCATCGTHLFGEEIVEEGADRAPAMAYVNRECLEGAAERGDAGSGADRRWLEAAPSE
ncbi:MAG: hypothetical protein GX652_00185 [Burkholderiaceae bacterium]|nr:hypothetical protein [Burkholderiaceae bacterium]